MSSQVAPLGEPIIKPITSRLVYKVCILDFFIIVASGVSAVIDQSLTYFIMLLVLHFAFIVPGLLRYHGAPFQFLQRIESDDEVLEALADFREADVECSLWKHAGHDVGDDGYRTTLSTEEDFPYGDCIDQTPDIRDLLDDHLMLFLNVTLERKQDAEFQEMEANALGRAKVEVQGKDQYTEVGMEIGMQGLPYRPVCFSNIEDIPYFFTPSWALLATILGLSWPFWLVVIGSGVETEVKVKKLLCGKPQARTPHQTNEYELAVVHNCLHCNAPLQPGQTTCPQCNANMLWQPITTDTEEKKGV